MSFPDLPVRFYFTEQFLKDFAHRKPTDKEFGERWLINFKFLEQPKYAKFWFRNDLLFFINSHRNYGLILDIVYIDNAPPQTISRMFRKTGNVISSEFNPNSQPLSEKDWEDYSRERYTNFYQLTENWKNFVPDIILKNQTGEIYTLPRFAYGTNRTCVKESGTKMFVMFYYNHNLFNGEHLNIENCEYRFPLVNEKFKNARIVGDAIIRQGHQIFRGYIDKDGEYLLVKNYENNQILTTNELSYYENHTTISFTATLLLDN